MLTDSTQSLTQDDIEIKAESRTVEILTLTAAFLVASLTLYLVFFDSAARL